MNNLGERGGEGGRGGRGGGGGGGGRTGEDGGPISDGEMNILRGGEWKVMKMRENN